MLVNSRLVSVAVQAGIPVSVLITVDEGCFLEVLPHPQVNINLEFQIYLNSLDASEREVRDGTRFADVTRTIRRFAELVSDALAGFEPDVIVCWCPTPHLRQRFSNALILHKEVSAFSRPPFQLMYYVDPGGFLKSSEISRYTNLPSNNDPLATFAFERIKQVIELAFDLEDNVRDLTDGVKGFDRAILAATHTNGVFMHDAANA
jgi:hypothetical protein